MSTASDPIAKSAINGIRTALGVGGVVSLLVGILILVWPGKTAAVVAAIIAIYAIVGGLVYAGLGIFSKVMGGWARVGHIIPGIGFVVAGVLTFPHPGLAVATPALPRGVASASGGWALRFASVGRLAGRVLFFSPVFGAVVLWWLLGISMVVLGLIQIVRAFTFGKNV